MAHGNSHQPTAPGEIEKPNTKGIWRVFWILLIVTAFEFLIAFTVPAGGLRTSVFVIMTLVKAFYIVGDFMHLKHEVKTLIWSVVLPCIFVVWLIVALLYEGGSILGYVYNK